MNRHTTIHAALFCILAAVLSPARAQTMLLECPNAVLSPFTIDLASGTVNGEPAKVTQASIDWQQHGGSDWPIAGAMIHNHMDRAANVLTQSVTFQITPGQSQSTFPTSISCTVGNPSAGTR